MRTGIGYIEGVRCSMVVYVVFANGFYIGCYDSQETIERALSRPDSRIYRDDSNHLNIDNVSYKIMSSTMVTEANLSRSN